MRILGIDYGDSRVGFAISDPTGFLASAIGTLHEGNPHKVTSKTSEYVKEYTVDEIVLGYPKNMNNTLGERAQKTESFANMLKEAIPNTPVILWDERGSTKSAINILNEANIRNKKRKNVVDTIAATIILQNYLDFKRR